MARVDQQQFWNARARENAAYFVENRLDYSEPDFNAFWASGTEVIDDFAEYLDLNLSRGEDVVEIGCGIGRLTRVLAGRARSVQALDVSQEMLALARMHNPELANVQWLLGDGRSLNGVPDGAADGVFSFVVFQHLPDPELTYGYVREMGRVLRAGGWAAFQVSDDPSVHRPPPGGLRGARRRIEASLGLRPKGDAHPAWLGSAIDLERLTTEAQDASLDVERVWGAGTQFCLIRLRRRS